MTNPWNLTLRECEALAATIENHGREKVTADALGVSRQAVTNRVREARTRMKVATRIDALIAYDRWARANQP